MHFSDYEQTYAANRHTCTSQGITVDRDPNFAFFGVLLASASLLRCHAVEGRVGGRTAKGTADTGISLGGASLATLEQVGSLPENKLPFPNWVLHDVWAAPGEERGGGGYRFGRDTWLLRVTNNIHHIFVGQPKCCLNPPLQLKHCVPGRHHPCNYNTCECLYSPCNESVKMSWIVDYVVVMLVGCPLCKHHPLGWLPKGGGSCPGAGMWTQPQANLHGTKAIHQVASR